MCKLLVFRKGVGGLMNDFLETKFSVYLLLDFKLMGNISVQGLWSVWGGSVWLSRETDEEAFNYKLPVNIQQYCFDQSSEWVGSYTKWCVY